MANTPQLYVDENTLGLELGTSLDLARKAPVKPDDEAALRAASKRLNIPLDSARTLPQQTKELAQQASFDPNDYAKRFPNSAKFLANQDNALVAVDDVEPLSAVEQATVNLIRQRMEPTALNPLAAAVQRLMPERAAAEEEVRKTLREQGFAAASAKRREVEQRLGALQPTGTIQATQGPAPSVGSVLSGMGTSLVGGARQARISGQLAVSDLFNALGATPNDVYTKDLIRKYDQETGRIADSTPAFETSTGRGLYAGAQSLAQQAPALAVSVATGSTIPALAAAGLNTAGEAYGRYRSRGGSAGEAALGAGGEAAVEILTEKLPMKFVVDNLGKAGFGQFLRGFIGRELATEQVATVLQDAIDTAVANPNKTWAEYWAERPDAAYQTALATIVQGGAIGAINTVLANTVGKAEMARQEAERAAMSAAGLEQLLTAAAQSQTRVRAPESFSQLVQQSAVQGGALTEVYFDAQPFVDALEQSGLTPEQIETLLPSVRDNLAEAVATNGTVMVPIGEMVTAFAGTGVEQALLQQARTEPDALSVADTAQAQALTEQLQQDAGQALAQQEQRKAWEESAKQVYDTMLGQLNTAGRFSNDVNKAQATVVRDFFTVMASRLGTTPAELYQRYPLRATATLPGGQVQGDVLEQSDAQRALAMSEDEYIAAINPTGETNTEDGSARLVRGDLSDPVGATVVRELDGGVTIERDAEGNFYARQGGDTIGEIINYGDEVNVNVLPEARGKGVAVNLVAEFMRVNPFFNAGSLTPGGEAVVRAAHRMLKGEVLNQSQAGERNLIVAHNLSAENVRHAVEIGGLAAPSLAITKAETPIQGFGEITLIGDTSLAKPSAKNPVFDADVYSPRFPDVKVNVDEKRVRRVFNPLVEAAQAAGVDTRGVDRMIEEMQRNRLGNAIGDVAYDNGLRYAYLTQVKGVDIDVPTKVEPGVPAQSSTSIVNVEPLASALKTVDLGRLQPGTKEAGELMKAYFDAQVNFQVQKAVDAGRDNPLKDGVAMATRAAKMFGTGELIEMDFGDGLVGKYPEQFSADGLYRLYSITKQAPQQAQPERTVIDRQALSERLSEAVSDEEIRAWAREQLAPAMGEKRIVKENGRTAEYTLDNVVKEMTRKVRDSEGFNYGLGNARSRGATRFKSLSQIQGQRDRVISKDESDAAIAENKKLYEAMLNDLLPYHPSSKERYGRGAWEALPDAIGESYTIGMDRALKENGFVDVPAEMVDRVKQFASDLVQLPTEYFEAKPQRAVGLSEFRAAVVPSDLSEDARQALTDAGLELVEYTKGDEQSRAEAVSGVATKLDVLFQGEQARATFNPATLNIALLEKADLSSFLHELGHFYFEVLADIASQPNAPQQIVDDMNTLLRTAGFEGTAAEWLQQPVNARRDAHEMVAESFEQYLFDGKAPSLEQQALFSRLRAWMVSVYRTIAQFLQTNRNAQLTDEVRGVFDRMLATDAQIEAARAARSFGPMFESAEQAGMTPEQFEQYKAGVQQETDDATRDLDARRLRDMRWLQNYRSKKLRELQKDAKAKRQAVLGEVTAEVDAQRPYQTLAFIRTGKLPDGTAKPEGMASTRLNRGIIESMYGEQLKVPDSLLSRDGVDPEIVASLFGYASADQMVREVANAEPRKELIAGMTDQRMLERFGDLATPEALERAADQAIANDAHARMVSTELAAVTKQLGSVQAISRAARDFAERSTGSKAIKYLRPDQAAADAARQRKAAEQALKKGDTKAAADAKRNELLAVELQRAQTKAKQEIVKARSDMRRLWGKDEQKAKTRDMNLVNAARAVVAQYGIAPERAGDAAVAYIDKVAAYDPELVANLTAMMSQAPAAKPFKDLTVDEFRAVRDVVQSLYYMSKRSKEIEIDGKKVQLDGVADELTNRLLDLSGGELPPLAGVESTATKWDHLKVGALGVRAMGTRVEQWADRLGPQFTQYIWNPVSEAVTRYRAKRNDMVGKYRDLLKQVAPGLTYRPIYAPELGSAGFTFNHGKVEILHALLHSGNPSNLRKLLLGRGWATVDESGNLDTRNWDQFVARAINEGIITKADYDFAQGVWDLLETTKVDAQRAHLEMYGYYFNEVTAQPIQTPFGEYRGGYVPAVADPISAPDASQKREMEDMNAVGNSFMFPTTGKGFTQARVEYNRPLMLDLRTLSSHIDKVTRFSYIEPTIRDVANLLKQKRIANALNRYDQGAIPKMLIPWLQRTAQQTTSLVGKDRYVDAFFRGLRSRSGMYLMFANVVNTLQQLTGFSVAALKVPAPMLLRAAYRYIQAPKRTAAEAAAISPWLAQRQSNQAFEMTQQINDILIDPNLYQKADAFMKKHAYFMQTALQNVMDTIVWTGAYDNALAKGAEPKQAMRYADESVRTTQGTFAPEDVSAMEVNTPFVQMFTQFWGYFNMLANTLGAESNKAIRDMGYMASTRRLAFIWFAGLALPAFVAELIASGAPDDEDDEDGDGVLDEWLAMFFGSQGRTLTAMVPVAGQAAQLVWNKLDDKWYNDKLNVSPALSLGESAVSGVASILQGKAFDERLTKTEVREMATLIGLATGMPTNVAARPIGYMLDVESGKQEPEGAGDVVWGLTTGR